MGLCQQLLAIVNLRPKELKVMNLMAPPNPLD